jgi:Ca-activated chloride channel homolog
MLAQTGELLNKRLCTAHAQASACRCLAVLIFLLILPGFVWPQQTPTPELPTNSVARPQQLPIPQLPPYNIVGPPVSPIPALPPAAPYKISVNVSSVVLHATVMNHNGSAVSGLGQDDFQVYEDGVAQPIQYFSHADIPVTVGLVLDNSGSMHPNRDEVIAAGVAFARSSNPQDQMFVVNFNEFVSLGLPADTPFTDQTGQLQVALSRFHADGETALYDAIVAALDHLKLGNRDKKVLIVVSDGGDNSSKYKLGQVLALAGHSGAIVYTIDIHVDEDLDRNPGALRQLAKATGGQSFAVESLPEVVPICERIAHDIREQYTLAYSPLNLKQDGAYRVILVKARAHGHGSLSVITRAGYYSPIPPPSSRPIAGNQSDRP